MSMFLVDFELDQDRETAFVPYLLVFIKWPKIVNFYGIEALSSRQKKRP